MRYLKFALGLSAVTGLMIVTALPAMAAPRWRQCKKVEVVHTGQWKDALCSEGLKEGEWLTMEVTETEEVTASGKGIEMEAILIGETPSTLRCEGAFGGWVGKEGNGGISRFSMTSCVRVSGLCESPVFFRIINLPWITVLEVREGKIRDKIVGSNGAPGYAIECLGGVHLKYQCTGALTIGLSNNANGAVSASFDAISEEEPGNCERAIFRGTFTTRQRNGHALYVGIN